MQSKAVAKSVRGFAHPDFGTGIAPPNSAHQCRAGGRNGRLSVMRSRCIVHLRKYSGARLSGHHHVNGYRISSMRLSVVYRRGGLRRPQCRSRSQT